MEDYSYVKWTPPKIVNPTYLLKIARFGYVLLVPIQKSFLKGRQMTAWIKIYIYYNKNIYIYYQKILTVWNNHCKYGNVLSSDANLF